MATMDKRWGNFYFSKLGVLFNLSVFFKQKLKFKEKPHFISFFCTFEVQLLKDRDRLLGENHRASDNTRQHRAVWMLGARTQKCHVGRTRCKFDMTGLLRM